MCQVLQYHNKYISILLGFWKFFAIVAKFPQQIIIMTRE